MVQSHPARKKHRLDVHFQALNIMGYNYNDILPFAQLVNAGFQPSTALPVLCRLDDHGTRLGGAYQKRKKWHPIH